MITFLPSVLFQSLTEIWLLLLLLIRFYCLLVSIWRQVLPGTKLIPHSKSPAPWWNDRCAEAVESRRILLRLYKVSPTLNNWLAYKRGNAQCRRLLRREKRKGWIHLCSEFTHKTPTATIWRFIRSYKNKLICTDRSLPDCNSYNNARHFLLSKLYFPSCFHLCYTSLDSLRSMDLSSSPYA